MAFNVEEFRSALGLDGARPNYFNVQLVFPGNVLNAAAAGSETTFMAKAAQLPGSTIGTVPLWYFGREIPVPGNRTFQPWTITVIQDEDFVIRNAFENWLNLINSHVGNIRDTSMVNSLGYGVFASVLQYGKTGNVISQYDFTGMFPTDLSPIDLDWGSNDTIMEWSATLNYVYWTKTTPTVVTDSAGTVTQPQ